MAHLGLPAVALIVGCVVCFLSTPGAASVGRRAGLVAYPRRWGLSPSGGRAVTSVGGAVLAISASTSLLFGALRFGGTKVALVGGTVLLAVGVADDVSRRGGVSPWLRIVVEVAVAAAAWTLGLKARTVGVEWLDATITIFILVGSINAFNLLDNMDGVAGSTATAVSTAICMLALMSGQGGLAVLAGGLTGAVIGFLRYNLVDARVYLGNGGALFLGFVLGACALSLHSRFGSPPAVWIVAGILSVPALDTSVVIVSRMMAARSPFEGGVDHLSHRLVRLGFSPRSAALTHAVGSLVGGAAAAMAYVVGTPLPVAAFILLLVATGLAFLRVDVSELALVPGPKPETSGHRREPKIRLTIRR